VSAQKLLDRLDKVKTCPGRHPSNWKACCPSHDDSDPSLSISETSEGNVLIKCWAGCTGADVMEAVGMEWHELLPYREMQKPERKPKPRLTEMDRQIERVAGYLNETDHDRLVIDIYRMMKEQGVTPSKEDTSRARQAFQALAKKGEAAA